MKLFYKVLWIDDNIENYIDAGIHNEFEEFLISQGFDPVVKLFETGEKALAELKRDNKFDIILSDYNIAGGEQGDTLIQRIRKGEIYTEILFYSAQPNFDEVAKNLYQERVSFLSLVGDDGFRLFKAKVYWLINLTVSKLHELNNVRGLVMSETSELDNLIEEILIEIMGSDSDLKEKVKNYLIQKVEENNDKRHKAFLSINDLSADELVRDRMLIDASKKSRALNEYLKLSGLTKIEDCFRDFHQCYERDVLKVRNDLAHAKSELIDGIEYLIISRRDGELPVKIDQAECIKIRGNLRKYSEILRKVKGTLHI